MPCHINVFQALVDYVEIIIKVKYITLFTLGIFIERLRNECLYNTHERLLFKDYFF